VTVQHNVGSLDVENGEIVNRMSGKKGFLGREQWHREEIIPVYLDMLHPLKGSALLGRLPLIGGT
jgi:hypothetical protein